MANLLPIPFRTTEPIPSLADSLVQHICEADSSIHPDAVKPDADGLAAQRKKLFGDGTMPLDVSEAVLTQLTAYYAQLSYALTKLPADIPIPFPWHPIFGASTSSILGGFPTPVAVALSNLQYERVSVLFDVAAMYSALGCQAKRTDQDGIKSCLVAFQKAAGVLEHLITLAPLSESEPPARRPSSPEFSRKALEALRDICLAQAQEAFWQKAVMDRLKNGTIAKLAAKVSEYYESAAASAAEAKGAPEEWPGFSFPPALLNHLNVKHLHFAAVAQFRRSIDDLGANRYGDELGRLTVAESLVKRAIDGPRKGVAESVMRDLRGLQTTLSDNLVRAEKDNRLIYLEGVTPASALPSIVPASMVKPTPPPEIVSPLDYLNTRAGGYGPPLFESLVPKEVSLAVRIYADRKETMLKEELVERKDELDSLATATLDSLGLPGSIQAIVQPVGLPPSLLAKAQEIRSSDGVERIKTMMKDVRRVAQLNQQILNEAVQVLSQETAEDEQHRRQFGTDRWTRPASAVVNAPLAGRAENLSATLQAAATSDGVVRAKFAEWEPHLNILSSDNATIDASIPSLSAPSLTHVQSSTLTELRRALQDLDDLRAMRARILSDAKRAMEQDDIRPQINSRASALLVASNNGNDPPASQFEELFDAELEKFQKYKRAMIDSSNRQDDILDHIKSANKAFIQSRKDDSVVRARETALQSLDNAFHKHQEITTNLQEGLKFYSDMSKLLNELRDSCKEWAYARHIESLDVLQGITGGMSRMNVSTPGVYDPSKHGGIRFG